LLLLEAADEEVDKGAGFPGLQLLPQARKNPARLWRASNSTGEVAGRAAAPLVAAW
jgi:hypothetical protein